MNFRILTRYWLIPAVAMLSFCTYAPDEDFYKQIEKVNPEDFTIQLNSHDDEDTIYLEGPVTFGYNIGSGNGQVEEVRIYIDNNLVHSNTESAGTFLFSPVTGIFRIKIEFVSTTGTGSLADQAGGERVKVWREWNIKAHVITIPEETLPDAPVLTTSIVNGYSVISWTPYNRSQFVHYRVEVNHAVVAYITDAQTSSWTDSTYTGNNNNRTYNVFTKNSAGIRASNESSLIGNQSLAMNATYNRADSTITVTLPKPVYYGAFKSYSIKENNVEAGVLTDHNQTSYTFKSSNVGINYSSIIYVDYNPKLSSSAPAHGSKTIQTSVSTQRFSRPLLKFTYSNQLGSVMGFWNATANDDAKLFRMNPATFALTDSITIFNGPGYHIPYNGVYAYYSEPKQLMQVDLLTHQKKGIDAITSGSGSGPSIIRGASTQLVSYSWFGPGSGSNPIYYYTRIYNMASNTHVTSTNNISAVSFAISDDGNYAILYNREIHRITGNLTALIGNLTYTGTWVGFRQDNCEEGLSVSGNTVYIYDVSTRTLKRTISAPAESSFITYDVPTKRLIFNNTTDKKLYSVHIETGNTKAFNVDLFTFNFMNGAIILNSKEYIKLYE